ncbi:hypothetical protein LMG23994_02692 [Cupriavidus pinatubonensis]|uniref:Uncharacterized protein n=1 Tax=Cupriavidus pinatubonensis TaxID=248026 RepID=A0ABN7YJU0_9BURK|nr:hypothetical protein LMG23994_02692 [Cupriavidus pinatubonensis]
MSTPSFRFAGMNVRRGGARIHLRIAKNHRFRPSARHAGTALRDSSSTCAYRQSRTTSRLAAVRAPSTLVQRAIPLFSGERACMTQRLSPDQVFFPFAGARSGNDYFTTQAAWTCHTAMWQRLRHISPSRYADFRLRASIKQSIGKTPPGCCCLLSPRPFHKLETGITFSYICFQWRLRAPAGHKRRIDANGAISTSPREGLSAGRTGRLKALGLCRIVWKPHLAR